MGYYKESLKELETQEHHECCQSATLYLFPPHKSGEFGKSIKYKVGNQPSWYIELGSESVEVSHCPWCGAHLTKRALDAGQAHVSSGQFQLPRASNASRWADAERLINGR